MSHRLSGIAVVVLALGIQGCGGAGAKLPAAGGGDGGAAANLVTLSGSYPLMPGEERYQCFTIHVSEALQIRRVVPHAGTAVHHVGVFTDLQKTEPEGTRECADMGIWGFVFGGGVGTGDLTMPDGVALPVDAGTPVILQVHFLNASTQAITSVSTVDLELADVGQTVQAAGSYLLGSLALTLPPQQPTNVDSTCTKHPTLQHVFASFPHMHRLGSGLSVSAASQKLVDLPAWNFGNQGMVYLSPEATIDMSMPIQTRCSYNNTTDQTVHFGLHTSDEMCIVVLYYWPAVAGTSGLSVCQN